MKAYFWQFLCLTFKDGQTHSHTYTHTDTHSYTYMNSVKKTQLWFSCLGGYLSVPDDYPLVLGCEEHVSSLCLRSLAVSVLER